MENFFIWLLDNQCYFKKLSDVNKFINTINEYMLYLNSEREIFYYLWVNGYSEQSLLTFLKLYQLYLNSYEYKFK